MTKPTAREIFDAAIDIRSPDERAAIVDQMCGQDTELRLELESLLAAHDQAHSFLESPPFVELRQEPAPSAAELIGSHIGPFKLLEQIGEGGFGQVFVAEQLQPVRRTVAIKLIKPGMESREVISRFEAERQALALMDHPNIAKVLDAGTTPSGRPYFVMELVRGVPITDYCDQNNLTPRERIELFVPVCQAIQHAHQKGIIHRDIKPSNVLVASLDGRSIPRVIDFGVAKAIHQPLTDATVYTRIHQMLGTPLYMSPEQAEMSSAAIDTRSDIYSLGVLLYELITGSTPFDRHRLAQAAFDEMRRIIREEDPPRPSTRLSESGDRLPSIAAHRRIDPSRLSRMIRGDLDWIVMKSLDKDRTRRYSSAEGLAKDVERFLNHEPVEAGPPSRMYRARKFIRRNRGAMITAAALLGVVLIGSFVSVWQAIRASEAEAVAIDERDQKEIARQDAVAEAERANQAAEAERLAKDAAEKRLGQLEKATEILASVFQNLDPGAEEQEGKPLRALMGDHLDDAAAQLSGDTVGDPLVVANLQRILGMSRSGLGQYDKAAELLQKSADTLTSLRGPDDPDTLLALNNLAGVLRMAGQLDESIALLTQTLEKTEAERGKKHKDSLTCRESLAIAYRESGKLDQAIPLFEETLGISLGSLGPLDPQTLSVMKDLAVAYLQIGQLDKAIQTGEELLELSNSVYGPSHPHTIEVIGNLASAYSNSRNFERAMMLSRQALELSKLRFGPEHPETLTAQNNLANTCREAGKVDEALFLFEETLQLERIRYTANHPRLLGTQNNLALIYLDLERNDKAIPLLEEVLRGAAATLGPDHPNTIITLNNLASAFLEIKEYDSALPLFEQAAGFIEDREFKHQFTGMIIGNLAHCYEKLNRPAEAEPWLRKWVAAAKESTGPDTLSFATAVSTLGWNLLQQKRWGEAETALREGLAIRQVHEPTAITTFITQSLLGEALLEQGKYAEAEPLLLQGYGGLIQHEAHIPRKVIRAGRLIQALERLPRLYEAWGQPEKARTWQERLDAHQAADGR